VEHPPISLPVDFHAWLREYLGWYGQYIAGFRAITEVSLYVESLRQGAVTRSSLDAALGRSVRALEAYLRSLAPMLKGSEHPHQSRMLLNPDRGRTVLEDGLTVYRVS